MSEQVELRVKSGIKAVLDDLEALKKKVEEVDAGMQKTGEQTSDSIKKKTKETETFFSNLQSFGRRVAEQLKDDFKALASIESLTAGLKLSEQFKNSISETVNLSNTIRKLGATFGIAGKDFASFQQTMSQGLGDIGMSSESAARALEGLSQTPVRGQKTLLEYSKTAGMLSSVGQEEGREGDIARLLAKVQMARGTSPNDLKGMGDLAESVRRASVQTGQGPTQVLSDMESMFSMMPTELRKSISSSGLANMAAARAVAGPNATKFLEEYLHKSKIKRMPFDARGGAGLFDDKGINVEKFKNFSQGIKGLIGQDPRLAAETLGLSEEAAEGFIRLSESLDQVSEAQERIRKSTGSLQQSYEQTMGLGQSFAANINKVKGNLSGLLEPLIHGGTDALSKASKSDVLSAGVVAGGGLLAALLTGKGLKGMGKAMLGTVTKGAVAEKVTGQKTVPVWVVNADEIGGGGIGDLPGTGIGAAKTLGIAGLAVGVGVAAREGVAYLRENGVPTGPSAQESVDWAQDVGGDNAGAAMEKLTNALIGLQNMLGSNYALTSRKQKIDVNVTTEKGLKATQSQSRGKPN